MHKKTKPPLTELLPQKVIKGKGIVVNYTGKIKHPLPGSIKGVGPVRRFYELKDIIKSIKDNNLVQEFQRLGYPIDDIDAISRRTLNHNAANYMQDMVFELNFRGIAI